jgi:hypothetical protein
MLKLLTLLFPLFIGAQVFATANTIVNINDEVRKFDNLENLFQVVSAVFPEDNYYEKTLKFLKEQGLNPKNINLSSFSFSSNKLMVKGFSEPIIFNFNKNSVTYFGIEVQHTLSDTPITFYNKLKKSWGGFKPFVNSKIKSQSATGFFLKSLLTVARAEDSKIEEDLLPLASMTATAAVVGGLISFPISADLAVTGSTKESFLKIFKRGMKGAGVGASVPLLLYAAHLLIQTTYYALIFDPTKPKNNNQTVADKNNLKISLHCAKKDEGKNDDKPGLVYNSVSPDKARKTIKGQDPLDEFWRKVCESETATADFNKAIEKIQNQVINGDISIIKSKPDRPAIVEPKKPQS